MRFLDRLLGTGTRLEESPLYLGTHKPGELGSLAPRIIEKLPDAAVPVAVVQLGRKAESGRNSADLARALAQESAGKPVIWVEGSAHGVLARARDLRILPEVGLAELSHGSAPLEAVVQYSVAYPGVRFLARGGVSGTAAPRLDQLPELVEILSGAGQLVIDVSCRSVTELLAVCRTLEARFVVTGSEAHLRKAQTRLGNREGVCWVVEKDL